MVLKKNIYVNMMCVTLLCGICFNILHSFFNIDMLNNEYNRKVVLFPYYMVTILFFIFALIFKNLKTKVSFSFVLFSMSIVFILFIYMKTGDFSHIKRVFINISPFLFYFSLFSEKKDHSRDLYKIITIVFYVCIAFSVLQVIFNYSVHEGRVNGIFQGPNSYAMYLLSSLLVFFVNKDRFLIFVCIILILLTKSSSALLILLLFLVLFFLNIRTFIVSFFVVYFSIYFILNNYTEGSYQMLDKILFAYNYFSSLTLDDLMYLSHYDSAFYVPDISYEIISPLNRVIQFNYYVFNTTFFELVFGASKPRFYESLLLILLSNFGLFSMIFFGAFIYFTTKELKNKASKYLFYSMLIVSFLALPVFSMSFSSWFVMASLYTSIRFSQSEGNGLQLEKV